VQLRKSGSWAALSRIADVSGPSKLIAYSSGRRLAAFWSACLPVYSQRMRGRHHSSVDMVIRRDSPRGVSAVGIFLFFGATMASLAGTTLIWRGTALDRVWVLNAGAYRQLAPLGRIVGVLFLVLSATLAVAGTGWFRRRLWGWRLAVGIIATQVLGDLVNFLMGDFVRGGIGFTIAGALLFYLLRPEVRAAFKRGTVSGMR